ncbi:actin cytoskeleton-regulatory complex protein pan1-like [Lates japonicus]|uniref:Actin cytoskeleton-regulatory complex protein pan1-like protein n=1 Tax=Lates japonicus TaxID=270547 RepID=A0AAD3MUW0_LATJO|nr:actin cytoskeleton-regulatory complex protein pan1-like protein [Lates japonicus]
MSSEVCPFCGKTYKRLKSHLPHCKAAGSSKTPLTEHHVKTNQTTSSSQPVAGLSEPTAKGKKSTQTLSVAASPQSKKSMKVSAVSSTPPQPSSQATPSKSVNMSSLSQLLSMSSTSPPPSTKKKKQKLSEQIKMAAMPSSATPSHISSPALSPSPTVSKPKKKSLRALIEAAKSNQVPKGSLEGARSASGDLPSGSAPFLSDPLRLRTTTQTETKIIPDNTRSAPPSTGTKPKDAPKKKSKRAAPSLSTINEGSARPHAQENFWVDSKEDVEDLSVNKIFSKPGSGLQSRITLQNVKATLGRAKTTSQSSGASILSQVETAKNLRSNTRVDTSHSPVAVPAENQKDVVSCLMITKSLSVQLKSKQVSLIPLQHDGSSQTKPTLPAAPLLSGSSQVSQATPPPPTVSIKEGLNVGHCMTGLSSISPSPIAQLSSPHLFFFTAQTLPARVETLRADDGSKLDRRKQNTAHNQTEGSVTQRSLGQVKLRELPEWLACRTPTRPRDVVEMVQRGWQWYYRRYIDVKKGGVGGLGMLLAGYCVLSYIWSYPHIKRDRWRKFH